MANRRYSLSNQSKPSSTTSSGNSSTPSASPSSSAPAGNNSGMNIPSASPGLLLAGSGGWLLARMFLFGGALLPIEAIAILIADGFAYNQGGKVQKNLALLIMALAGINLFFPGFNQGVKDVRETQINPPVEMSPIVINRDGEYDLPARPLKVCFKQTGSSSTIWINQEVSIDNSWRVVENYSKCHDLPTSVSGKKVSISLGNPIKPYTQEIRKQWNITDPKITNDYEYYSNIDGGQSGYPIIQAR